MPTKKKLPPLIAASTGLLVIALLMVAGSGTDVQAQQPTLTAWYTGAVYVNGIDIDSTGQVWFASGGPTGGPAPPPMEIRQLDPGTNQLTRYFHSRTDVFGGTSFNPTNSQVALDPLGNVWFTSPNRRVNRLDTVTGEVTGWPLPDSAVAGTIAVDSQGDVWLSFGTRIGRLNAATNTLTEWTLPAGIALATRPIDSLGRVWFGSASTVGFLDPSTNSVSEWPTPAARRGLSVDAQGLVWYAVDVLESNVVVGGKIVRLNPATDEVTEWPCPPGCTNIQSVYSDGQGAAWFVESFPFKNKSNAAGRIGRLDPAADPPVFTEWFLPSVNRGGGVINSPQPKAVIVDSVGGVWVTYSGSLFPSLRPGSFVDDAVSVVSRFTP